MMKFFLQKGLLLLFLVTVFSITGFSQTAVPSGINYQAIARNASGALISNQAVSVKIGIRVGSVSGTLEWEETHQVSTNQFGLFNLVIGKGTTTGLGTATSFSAVKWASADHFLTTAIDPAGGTAFIVLDTTQLWSVPYALHTASADHVTKAIRLNELADVDTIGVKKEYTLKWDGAIWKPAKDNGSDTAKYAINAGNSVHADTAAYSKHQLFPSDTIKFSHHSDTAKFAYNATNSVSSATSHYCDTAKYALNAGGTYPYWNLTGNAGTSPTTNFIGTTDNKDLAIKTNNTERMRITATGKVGIGIAAPVASLQVNGDDGFFATGTFGSGTSVSPGAGTRMHWYPKKAAFRAGYVAATQWDDSKIGLYSFAEGYSNTASGAYSTAIGYTSTASGSYSVAIGYGAISSLTSCISIGSSCQATGEYAVALGRGIIASDSSAVGIGYHSNAIGKYSLAFGANTTASGNYSTTMGWYANTNGKKGSFVYADNSSTTPTVSTVDNQFVVRASGGVMLYSSTDLSTGVALAAGGGSWTNISDMHKKENFQKVDGDKILKGIEALEITSWNYKTQAASIRHIGPMAQDFYKAFNFGEGETTITSVDIDGINLIALKTLALKTKALKENADEVELLKNKIEKLEKEKMALEKRIVLIEKQMDSK
jgi:hypothetical protein